MTDPSSQTKVLVYGPAYLDIVMRVGLPLVAQGHSPIDKSVDGTLQHAPDLHQALELVDPSGKRLILTGLDGNRHPTGRLRLSHNLLDHPLLSMPAIEVTESLGGMGAGYAAALGGELVSALSDIRDQPRDRIEQALQMNRVRHCPILIHGQATDWTLIVSSGRHGDKLPVGLRGCHAALRAADMIQTGPWGVVLGASLHNALLAELLAHHADSLRVLAPAMRNCRDQLMPLGDLAGMADLISLNHHEWNELRPADRQAWLHSDAIICVTQGPKGAHLSWVDPAGNRLTHHEPLFTRTMPPVDTNRAGEAFAAFLLRELIQQGWSKRSGPVTQEGLQWAARVGSAAAGLTVNRPGFGFPSVSELVSVIKLGQIS